MALASAWSRSALWIAIGLLLFIMGFELFWPSALKEGFAGVTAASDGGYLANLVPRRGDVGPEEEEGGYITDKRYFSGYSDVQRLGVNHDWCRMVSESGSNSSSNSGSNSSSKLIFACALAGTENLSSVSYSTGQLEQSQLSRDDYLRNTTGSGRNDYCRILKINDQFQVVCNIAGDLGFSPGTSLIPDNDPPKDVARMLTFYDGLLFWLRMADDLVDYAGVLTVSKGNGITIEELPPVRSLGWKDDDGPDELARGLQFNGVNQFLRIGDSADLSFGAAVSLRTMRAINVWVYFDEFTNNARIIDFGNGSQQDNIILGILGTGNPSVGDNQLNPLYAGDCPEDKTFLAEPSGAQRAVEMSPQELMATSRANIDEWECPGPEAMPRQFSSSTTAGGGQVLTATFLYEIWDSQQRKMRIVVNNAIPLKKWTHIVISALSSDAYRPDLGVYINGQLIFTQPSGWLPQSDSTTHNYIGKSNTQDQSSQFSNKDMNFKGKIFDLRAYNIPLTEQVISDTYQWGKAMLGLKADTPDSSINEDTKHLGIILYPTINTSPSK